MDRTLLSTQVAKLPTSFNALHHEVRLGSFVFIQKWDMEAAELLTDVNHVEKTDLEFHTPTELLVLYVKVVEIDAKRAQSFHVRNSKADWRWILGYSKSNSVRRS